MHCMHQYISENTHITILHACTYSEYGELGLNVFRLCYNYHWNIPVFSLRRSLASRLIQLHSYTAQQPLRTLTSLEIHPIFNYSLTGNALHLYRRSTCFYFLASSFAQKIYMLLFSGFFKFLDDKDPFIKPSDDLCFH